MAQLHELMVQQKVMETAGSASIYFHIPEDLQEVFVFKPGQYLTVEATIDEKKIRRAYSLCTSPAEGVGFTVKKVEGGLMSTFLLEQVNEGDTLSVLKPYGKFVPEIHPERRVTYYLFGAGSGITPLMSIIKTVLESEPLSTLYLLYGNRSEEQIIFRKQLEQLTIKHEGQLLIEHALSQPQDGRSPGLWHGKTGRIDAEMVREFLIQNPKQTREEKFFVCGPGSMMDTVKGELLAAGVHPDDVKEERFQNELIAPTIAKETSSHKATIHLDGNTVELEVKDKTVLDTLIDAGYDPPYSCTSGVCTTCMAKLEKGTVEMEVNYGLDEDEVKEGFILTCQSHPTSDEIELTYDI